MKIPGFYIAHHLTFDAYFGANQVFKIGLTSDLRRRLQDNAFETCFLHKFTYVATIETDTTKRAQQIEKAVLQALVKRSNLCGTTPARGRRWLTFQWTSCWIWWTSLQDLLGPLRG